MPIAPYYTTFSTTSHLQNPWTGNSAASGDATIFHLLHDLTIADGSIAISAAPGAGDKHIIKHYTGADAGVGTAVEVSGASATSARTNMSVTLDDAADNSAGEGYYVYKTTDGTPSSSKGMVSFVYTDATDATVNWYGWGDLWTTDLLSGASGASRYMTFGCAGASTDTEAEVQMPWPCNGYFQYVRGAAQTQAAKGDVTVYLRVNGADSALSLTKAAGVGTISDTATIVSVSAGDLISWRIVQASPYGSFNCALMAGFIAS